MQGLKNQSNWTMAIFYTFIGSDKVFFECLVKYFAEPIYINQVMTPALIYPWTPFVFCIWLLNH